MANMLTGIFVGHFPIADAHSPTNPTVPTLRLIKPWSLNFSLPRKLGANRE
ncbi:MAG: hypothetical protein OXU23_06720 [Candidatus Poribacteria bacterium]|nr:hypothetical protein [Candidatus Poribacteria bacterium]